eukprot:6321863-Pyramimonas_sp.AAC.1
MRHSPWRRAPSFYKFTRGSRIECVWSSSMAFAIARRTLLLNICNRLADFYGWRPAVVFWHEID